MVWRCALFARQCFSRSGAGGGEGKAGDDHDEEDVRRPASREESRPGFLGAARTNESGIVAPMDKRANRVSETEKVSDN